MGISQPGIANLSNEELTQAASLIRAPRAALTEKGYQGGAGFRIVLALSATLMAEARDAYNEES